MQLELKAEGRGRRVFLAALAVGTVAYLAAIWFAPPWLIGTPEYKWPVLRHGSWPRLPWGAAIMAAGVVWWVLLAGRTEEVLKARRGRIKLYVSLLLLGAVFQLGPAAVHNMGLIEYPLRVYLPDHTSYFTDAAGITDLSSWIEEFPEHVPEFATHTRTHPPGAALIFYAAQRAMARLPGVSSAYVRLAPRSEEAMTKFHLTAAQTAAGGLMALVLFGVAALMVPLTFALGRTMTTDRNALLGAALFATSPAFSHKTPILDHLLAMIILAALWLTITAVRERKIWRVAAAGAIMGAGLWVGTAVLAALPLIAVFTPAAIYQLRRDDSTLRDRVVLAGCIVGIAAGVALVTLFAVGLALGSDYIAVYQAITRAGWTFNNEVSGRYHSWMWIAFNPYEVLAWAGVPLAALFALAVLHPWPAQKDGAPSVLPWTLALAAFLIALDVSGKVCYEASRLAWFAFPLIALIAAPTLTALTAGRERSFAGTVLGLQASCALMFRMIF